MEAVASDRRAGLALLGGRLVAHDRFDLGDNLGSDLIEAVSILGMLGNERKGFVLCFGLHNAFTVESDVSAIDGFGHLDPPFSAWLGG